MARKVLGNDPFRRGAAARDDLPEAPKPPPPPKPPEPAKAAKARPDTPELQVPRGAKGPGAPRITPAPPGGSAHAAPKGPLARHEPVAHPGSPKVKGEPTDPHGLPVPSPGAPRPQGGAPTASVAPRAHAGTPSVPFDPVAHASAPSAVPLGSAPRPHSGSPTVPFEPTPHSAAPSAMPLGSAPRPHAGSPSVPFEATPHAGTPSVAPRAHPGSPSVPFEATPHAGTPSVAQAPHFEPTPHADAPSAVPLGSAPRPHPGSPSVPFEPTPHAGTPSVAPRAHAAAPSVPFEATPHADAPSAVPLGSAPRPHPGSPSVPFEPTPHAGTPSVAPRAHAEAPSVPFEATPHADAPSAVPMGRAPRPPPSSPTVPFEATPHAGTRSVARATPPAHVQAAPPSPAEALARPPASLPGAIKGLWRALRTAGGLASRGAEVDAWGKDAELTRQLRPLAELLYEKYWRVHTEGIENLPRGGCILVANHAGALPLDGPVLHLSLKRERPELADARWLLEDQVFHAPFIGLLANRMGAVRASPENAMRLLGEGRPVIVFPEGFHGLSKRFGERYQLRRFGRGGYLKIAIRAGVPVVPVAIVGGEESMPLLAKVPGSFLGVEYLPVTLPPLPARWFIRFGAPIDFADAPAAPEDDLAWIERTNVAVRDEIERMLGELLAGRDRVF